MEPAEGQEQAPSRDVAPAQQAQGPQAGTSGNESQADEKRAAAQEAIASLSREHIEQIARLLGWQRISDLACARIASVAMLLKDCWPQHRELLLTALDQELQRWAAA